MFLYYLPHRSNLRIQTDPQNKELGLTSLPEVFAAQKENYDHAEWLFLHYLRFLNVGSKILQDRPYLWWMLNSLMFEKNQSNKLDFYSMFEGEHALNGFCQSTHYE